MKFAKRFWMVQFVSLLLGGLPFIFVPEFVITFTTFATAAEVTRIEIGQIRMVGVASIAVSLMTLLATTRQVLAWQRGMAAIFIVFFLQWSTTLLFNQAQGYYRAYVPYGTLWIGYAYAVINLFIMLQPGRNAPVPQTRTDPMPRRLRILWAIQGVFYLCEAAICLYDAESTLRWVTAAGLTGYTPVAIQQVPIFAAWTTGFALLAIYASLEQRIRDWRQYRWVFLVSLLVRAGGVAANVQSGYFEPVVGLTLGVPALVFATLGFRWTLGEIPTEFREEPGLRPLRNADSDAPAPRPGESGVVWFWTFQTLALAVTGFVCMLAPQQVVTLVAPKAELLAVSDPALLDYAADGLRITGAFLVGLAGFNVFALMMSQTVFRRRFAIAFTVALGASCVALWLDMGNDVYTGPMAFICGFLSLLALLNLRWAIQRPPGAMSQDDAGVAGSKPASSYMGWLVQLLLLAAAGVSLLFATESVLVFLSGTPGLTSGASQETLQLVHRPWHLVGILSVSIAVLTAFGMGSQRDSVWRGFAFFGGFAFIVVTVAVLFVTYSERYHVASLSVFAAGVFLFYMNRWIRRQPATWNTEDTHPNAEAWTLIDLVAGPLMALSVLLTKRRSSHLMGSGARGSFEVSDEVSKKGSGSASNAPSNDFFRPGTRHKVQVRFANLTELDDASLDVRGCSIKFSEHRSESPLDLLMNTGAFCPAYNLLTFAGFVASKFLPVSRSEAVVKSNLVAREGGIAGLRRAPDSYAHLRYHSQIVRHWVDDQDVRHLVRYRCIPNEALPESGLPSDEDASQIWSRERLAGESRPTNYLRQEIKSRIEREGVELRLEAQFHEPEAGDTDDWYNAAVEWDERICPWIKLGSLTLDGVMTDADTELLMFNPGNHPMSLGIPRSSGPLDFRSMGDSEARVVHALQRFRLWMTNTFGPPPFGAVQSAPEQQR